MFTLKETVRIITFNNTSTFELTNRNLLQLNYRTNIIVFNKTTIKPRLPTIESNLPKESQHLIQKTDNITTTIINNITTLINNKSTNHYPNKILHKNK